MTYVLFIFDVDSVREYRCKRRLIHWTWILLQISRMYRSRHWFNVFSYNLLLTVLKTPTSSLFHSGISKPQWVSSPSIALVLVSYLVFQLTYPINNTNVGGGEKDNVVFHAKSTETLSYPFTLTYKLADDPNKTVLTDILTKCGITGGSSSDLTVNVKLTVRTLV